MRVFSNICIFVGIGSILIAVLFFYPSGHGLWASNATKAWMGYADMREAGFITEHPEVLNGDDPEVFVRRHLYWGTEQPMWMAFALGTSLIVFNAAALVGLGVVVRRHVCCPSKSARP